MRWDRNDSTQPRAARGMTGAPVGSGLAFSGLRVAGWEGFGGSALSDKGLPKGHPHTERGCELDSCGKFSSFLA